ncbi:hypothetical protein [Spiroplasma endosymbiont of Labia minor]|uniref:hypothetical protein n=1 Tax=Spiroplasma endosymbiont of Labia minor TaxID=3066305 RepID=UPI0030CB3A68
MHLEILSTLSVSLMNKKIIDALNELLTENEIFNFISTKILLNANDLNENSAIDLNSNFVVTVCACTYGLSHTYMAENRLLNYAKENNLKIKIQTVGSKGNLNKITEEEFEKASLVILALDKEIDLPKVNNKNIVKIRTIDVIKNTNKIFEHNNNLKIIKNISYFFKVKMPQSWMQVASKSINYLQWITLAFAIIIIFHSFNVINQEIYNKINQIVQYGTLAIPSIASYILIKYFTKDQFSANAITFILLGLNFYINLSGEISNFGLISVVLSSVISIIFYNFILKPLKNRITLRKIRGSIEFFLKIIIITSLSAFLYFMSNYIPKINVQIYMWIYMYSNNNWWFRILVAFIFIYPMLHDMGGPEINYL